MLYGLYLSAAGMQAQEVRQSVISNNLANAQTVGFKRDLAVMETRANAVHEDPAMFPYRIPVMQDQGGGVHIAGGGVDLSQAALQKTGNATDLALDGRGFFEVQGENGQKLLTRNGQFLINDQGTLVMAGTGRAVLSADGTPVQLDPTLPVNVLGNGKISQGDGASVQLGLADVSDPRRLVKLGDNLLTVDKPESMTEMPANTQVRQYHVEESGVDPIVEMVSMMEGQRAFEANAKMITYQDTTLSELNGVGKVA